MIKFPVKVLLLLYILSIISGCTSGKYIAAGLYSSRAESALSRNNKKEALLEFEKSLKIYPGSVWAQRARYMRGMIFFDLNDFKSAKNEIKKLLEDFPDTDFRFDALFCMGNILMSQGDYLSSKSEFLKIINSKSPAGAPEEIVQKAEERLNQIEKWLKNRNDSQQLVNNWGKYRDAYNYHAKLIMQIATGRVVEPEEIHRAFENVRKYRELYEKQLSGRDSVNNKALTEKARKEYYSSYEKYINLVKDLSPDEYDRPEIHEALEEYQKNKKKYLNLKLEKDDVEKDDLKDTDNSSGRLFHKLQDSGSEEIINSREQIF